MNISAPCGNPCMNGGTFTCECRPGFFGDICEAGTTFNYSSI